MKLARILLALICPPALGIGPKLTIERIFENPELDGARLAGLKFSPNGKRLTFLRPQKEDYEVLDLWEFDLQSGKPKVLVDSKTIDFGKISEAEKSRRERMRISRRGIVEYFWSKNGEHIVFPAGEDLYLYTFGQRLKRLTNTPAAELDVKFSPKDHFVSFVREQNLFIVDLKSGKEFAVTKGGNGDIADGVAEFIAQEEMGRFTGYWWSEDETFIAFTETDESGVKSVERYEINEASVVSRKQRYPEAGTANAKIRLGVVSVKDVTKGSAKPAWIKLAETDDIYLPAVKWTKDHQLAYTVENRAQTELKLYLYDPLSEKVSSVLSERDSKFINLNDSWSWLKSSPNFIWASEKSGFMHLYLYDRSGKQVRALTSGEWPVDRLVGVDEPGDWVYFAAGKKTPLESHLYRVSLSKPGEPEQLTLDGNMNSFKMDEDAQRFVRFSSSSTQPPQSFLHNADGTKIAELSTNTVDKNHPLFPYRDSLVVPEYGSFKGPSGDLIYYRLYKPKNFDSQRKYPLIVSGYGGPGSQVVSRAWEGKGGLFANILVERGFLVASFDNRGSSRRGRKFENPIHLAAGTVEVEDQKAGVQHLVKLGFVNPNRVGFFGWSYGGYLSMNLAAKASDTFQANVAVAPVADWSSYDTHYTERYMGKPQDNKKAYERGNVLNFIPQIKGKLLIMHGMADDNVLFTHSTMIFKKLQESGKIYESVTYPGAKHGIYGKANQAHVWKTIADFFERSLLR